MSARSKTEGARRVRKAPLVAIRVDTPEWRNEIEARHLLGRAARLALKSTPHADFGSPRKKGKPCTATILLTDDPRMRALNAAFRGKDKPTNVLSFPAPASDEASLGDIAMAHGVIKRESRAQAKRLAHHAAHLAAHGVLHLLGYDHETAKDAREMEALETAILAKLGIGDPYAPRPLTGRRKAA